MLIDNNRSDCFGFDCLVNRFIFFKFSSDVSAIREHWHRVLLFPAAIQSQSLVQSQILVTRLNSTMETPEQICEICSKLTIKTLERRRRSGLYHSMQKYSRSDWLMRSEYF